MTKAEIDAKMEDIIEFSEVRDFIDTPVKRYSSGMYVKLAFSVAAHLDSEIMIMDEVLAVGDMAFQKKCLNKMREAANKEGRTVLYVSHNMNTIRQLCDRCIVLDKGKKIFEGDVEDAIQIYMGTSASTAGVVEYDECIHQAGVNKNHHFLKGAEVLERETSICVAGDELKLILHCDSIRKWNDICFRMEIKYQDGYCIGTMLSADTVTIEEGKSDVLVQINTEHMTPGRYRIDIVAYQINAFGNQILIDGVYPGLILEIVEKENDIIWLDRWWGHVRLNDLKISNM
jgi:lipopolysaccharide transport system ATP-binding protein